MNEWLTTTSTAPKERTDISSKEFNQIAEQLSIEIQQNVQLIGGNMNKNFAEKRAKFLLSKLYSIR